MSQQYKIEPVVKSFCGLGEGPHWDASSQTLYCVDLFKGGVHIVDPEKQDCKSMSLNGTVSFVIPSTKGGLVIGLNKTISRLDFATKTVKTMAQVEEGPQNQLNDGKCDASGRLWTGTLAFKSGAEAVPGAGSIYSLSKHHKLTRHLGNMTISNGLDWSNDNSVMYFIDSAAMNIWAFDFDLAKGTINNKRSVAELSEEDKGKMFFDGMCVDADDKLWVAFNQGGKVCRIDPQTGKTLQTITFPATITTSCCFGGENLDELFVTSGTLGLSDAEKEAQPLAGSLFRVTGLQVKGRLPHNFEG